MKITPRVAGAVAAVVLFAVFFARTQFAVRDGASGGPNPGDAAGPSSGDADEPAPPAVELLPLFGAEDALAETGTPPSMPSDPELPGHPLSVRFSAATGAPLSVTVDRPEGGTEVLPLIPAESEVPPWIRVDGRKAVLAGSPAFRRPADGSIEFRSAYSVAGETAFHLERVYTLVPGEFLVNMEVTIRSVDGRPMPDTTEIGIPIAGGARRSFIAFARGRTIHPASDTDEVRAPGNARWAGLEEPFFAVMAIPAPQDADRNAAPSIVYHRTGGLSVGIRPADAEGVLESGASADYSLFIGPKSDALLSGYQRGDSSLGDRGEGLRSLVYPRGFLRPFMTIIASLLRQIHLRLLGDYGLAVILLALLAKLTLAALSRKSIESTAALRDVQGRLAALQKDAGLDAAARRERTAELYKEAGVKPLSGVINLLVHLILFIVVSRVFTTLYDFRNAASPALGLANLARPDSLYSFSGGGLPILGWTDVRLLPLLVLGAAYIQSRVLQPPHPENRNQVILSWVIPVALFFVFYRMPSAAVLYWLSQTLFSLAETLIIRRRMNSQ